MEVKSLTTSVFILFQLDVIVGMQLKAQTVQHYHRIINIYAKVTAIDYLFQANGKFQQIYFTGN